MKVVAAFRARLTIWVSAEDHSWLLSAPLPLAMAPCCCCRNFCCFLGVAFGASCASSKPFDCMKSSRDLSMRDSWRSSLLHGKPLAFVAMKDQESSSLLKTAPPATVLSGGAAWCLESTVIAALSCSIAWTSSVSSPWNSVSCFSRMVVASARDCLSDTTSASNSLIFVSSSDFLAARPSMEDCSASILAVDAEIAVSFS
mmetsp:Transcript_20628/g.71363  ORF Transcript_20628/g.71363 Transcript_20628/m.71363 type:complete len:200 (+) Transcript_20628:1536-2135(+)